MKRETLPIGRRCTWSERGGGARCVIGLRTGKAAAAWTTVGRGGDLTYMMSRFANSRQHMSLGPTPP